MHMYLYMYVYMCMCMYAYIYIYTHIYTYTYENLGGVTLYEVARLTVVVLWCYRAAFLLKAFLLLC